MERKTRRVSDGIDVHAVTSTDASASITGRIRGDGCDGGDQESLQSEEDASNTAGHEESLQTIGKLVQDLFHYGHPAAVRAALDALYAHLNLKGKSKNHDFVTVGGCAALAQLLNNCVRTAAKEIREQSLSTELLGELSELKTVCKTLRLVALLLDTHRESRVAMTAIGGVEAIVSVLKTFRNCEDLQTLACYSLRMLAQCKIGKITAVEAGAMQVLLVAINDYLGRSANTCGHALYALVNLVKESKENTELLISLGGAAAVVKVKKFKWGYDSGVQPPLRNLATLLTEEIDRWDD
jgi:hypothetical protein